MHIFKGENDMINRWKRKLQRKMRKRFKKWKKTVKKGFQNFLRKHKVKMLWGILAFGGANAALKNLDLHIPIPNIDQLRNDFDQDEEQVEEDKLISTRVEAQERDIIDTTYEATSDSIKKAIRDNTHLSEEIQNYLTTFTEQIAISYPSFDKSILKRNIELLTIKECTKEEMNELTGSSEVYTSFSPLTHELCLLKERDGHIDYSKIGETISNTFGYMARQLAEEKEDGTMVDISFSDGSYGKALQAAFNQEFIWNVGCPDFTNTASYDNFLLLKNSVMSEDVLFNYYMDGNIHDFANALQKINPNLNVEDFIERMDEQYQLKTDNNSSNDYDADLSLFTAYNDNYMAYYDLYMDKYEENYNGYLQCLKGINTSEKIQKQLVKDLKTKNEEVRKK